jgi:hypothetical protein
MYVGAPNNMGALGVNRAFVRIKTLPWTIDISSGNLKVSNNNVVASKSFNAQKVDGTNGIYYIEIPLYIIKTM